MSDWVPKALDYLKSPMQGASNELALIARGVPQGGPELWAGLRVFQAAGVHLDPEERVALAALDFLTEGIDRGCADSVSDSVSGMVRKLCRAASSTAPVAQPVPSQPRRDDPPVPWLDKLSRALASPGRAAIREAGILELTAPTETLAARHALNAVVKELGLVGLVSDGVEAVVLGHHAGQFVKARVGAATEHIRSQIAGICTDLNNRVMASVLAGQQEGNDDLFVTRDTFLEVRRAALPGVSGFVGVIPDPMPPDHPLRGITPLKGASASFVILGETAGRHFFRKSLIAALTQREHAHRQLAIDREAREELERQQRIRDRSAGSPDELLRRFLVLESEVAQLKAAKP